MFQNQNKIACARMLGFGFACALLLVVIGYSAWVCFIFRNPEQEFSRLFMTGVTFLFGGGLMFVLYLHLSYRWGFILFSLLAIMLALGTTFIVAPLENNLLVIVPEKGGVSQARVIKDIGLLEHPFSDKIIAIHSSYTIEADIIINADDGKKIIAQSHKKEFQVIDPIAVYHRIGAADEAVERHLRDGIKRCFHSEMSSKQFSSMLAKKTGESFSISSRPCELGLKYYGLEPIGGNQISFADFRMADVLPIRFQIQ